MATLAECIQLHETARQQEPAVAATVKGIAVVAIYQIKRALIDMDPADREDVRQMVTDMLIGDRERAIYGPRTTREG